MVCIYICIYFIILYSFLLLLALLLEFWKGLIDYFDVDDSKSIDREEFSNVLVGLQSDQELVDDMGEEAIVCIFYYLKLL